MKTRSQYHHDQLSFGGGYIPTRGVTTMEDSSQRPLHDLVHRYQIMEDSSRHPLHDPFHRYQIMEDSSRLPLHDPVHRYQIMEDSSRLPLLDSVSKDQSMEHSSKPPLHDPLDKDEQNQIDEGYASTISSHYSGEIESSGSDYSEGDDAEDDDAMDDYSANYYSNYDIFKSGGQDYDPSWPKAPGPKVEVLGSLSLSDLSESDDEATQESTKSGTARTNSLLLPDNPAETTKPGSAKTKSFLLPFKPTEDIWKKSWPKEGHGSTESAWVNVYGYYRKRQDCGGYAIILRNMAAQPIAAIAKFSPNGISFPFQVLDGLVAGLRLAAEHGCSTPLLRCNSHIVVTLVSQMSSRSCKCQGSKIGNICHKCASSILYCLKGDRFDALVPLLKDLQGQMLHCLNFSYASRKMNEPAHWLAKETKKKALMNVEKLVDRANHKLVDLIANVKPNEFPDELVSYLLDDAYDSICYNLDARDQLVF